MAENLITVVGTREEQYKSLLPQLEALVNGEYDLIANMANISAALKAQFNFFWVGFYLVKEDELVLGPFQGPIACTRIKKGRGVCGKVWALSNYLIVPDVNAFPGHIACNSLSQSEIVLPLLANNEVFAVLDVDSDLPADFSEIDAIYLQKVICLLEKNFSTFK